MSTPTKKCKYCLSEIPRSAKVCPQCKRDLRSWFAKHPFLTILLILFFLWILTSSSVEKKAKEIQIQQLSQQLWKTSTWATLTTNNDEERKLQELINELKNKINENIKIIDAHVEDEYGFPHLIVKVQNISNDKTIDAFKLRASFKNNFNETVYHEMSWNKEKFFYGIAQEPISPWEIRTFKWLLTFFEKATKVDTIEIIKLHIKETDQTYDLSPYLEG